MKSRIRKGRLQLAERVLKQILEGRRTGGDFGATERMSGRFINKMEKDGASPEQIASANQQSDRISDKMTARDKKRAKAAALKGPLKVKGGRIRKGKDAGLQHLLTRLKGNSAHPDNPSKPSSSDVRAAVGKPRYRNK